MRSIITLIVIIFILINLTYSQTTEAEKVLRVKSVDSLSGWKTGGVIRISFSQASFTNWAAGGQNSISLNGLLSTYANFKKDKNSWDNMLDLGYGFLQQGKDGKVIKTDDKIDFTSKYGRAASEYWYYAALLNFKTQMAPGYNYPNDSMKISNIFAPAYLLLALGMDYKPNEHLSAFFAPLNLKNTFVNNATLADAGAFGVDKASYDANGILLTHGKKFKSEFGGYVRIVYQTTFFEDKSVSLLTKLDLFSNYIHNPQNVDVSWETVIGFKVNKYISATITTQLVYDDDVKIAVDKNGDGINESFGPRTQFKEVLGIGFSYNF